MAASTCTNVRIDERPGLPVVTVRATQKVLKSLPPAEVVVGDSDAALGDWYVNRVVIDRRPLLLLVSAKSLLSILVPARDVRSLPERLAGIVAARLERLGVDRDLVRAEVEAMSPVLVAKTRDRSVLGAMVEFAKVAPYLLPERGWDENWLPAVEAGLADMPCLVTQPVKKALCPVDDTPRLLAAKWG
jgi:hypothetical protein